MFYAKLNNGREMPLLGYGTYKITDQFDAKECVLNALEVGYRHIDTATLYRNEVQIGQALRESGLPRSSLFVTDKLWTDVRSSEAVRKSVDTMLNNLKTDYLDLLLIHWPTPANIEVWKEMENLHKQGVLKSIGVSNFLPHHIDQILAQCEIVPAVNQVELHPLFQQKELRSYCKQHGILVEAWSPLMRGSALQNEELQKIADKYNKSVAQIIVRYDLQLGLSVLPKSTKKQRIKENFDVFDFHLSNEDLAQLEAMDQNARQYRHPDHHGY